MLKKKNDLIYNDIAIFIKYDRYRITLFSYTKIRERGENRT